MTRKKRIRTTLNNSNLGQHLIKKAKDVSKKIANIIPLNASPNSKENFFDRKRR